MNEEDSTKDDYRARSEAVRRLVQHARVFNDHSAPLQTTPTRRLVQFWDDPNSLPSDVKECLDSWRFVEDMGIGRVLFDARKAQQFIRQAMGPRHETAYGRCHHPAMQSDFFRLCYIYAEGGCYVDADDVYLGTGLGHLFHDARLRVQPLCYDITTDQMVRPSVFLQPGAGSPSWIFYFNNNPLIAPRTHPIIGLALEAATQALERAQPDELPDIQSTTGPGVLTKSIVEYAMAVDDVTAALAVLDCWEHTAESRWPLSYRSDARNWRLSTQQKQLGGRHDNHAGDAV